MWSVQLDDLKRFNRKKLEGLTMARKNKLWNACSAVKNHFRKWNLFNWWCGCCHCILNTNHYRSVRLKLFNLTERFVCTICISNIITKCKTFAQQLLFLDEPEYRPTWEEKEIAKEKEKEWTLSQKYLGQMKLENYELIHNELVNLLQKR